MDADLMESLLVNLLDNAVKASKPGSEIELKAWDNTILVRDHGKGIPEEEISRVTEHFIWWTNPEAKKQGALVWDLPSASGLPRSRVPG